MRLFTCGRTAAAPVIAALLALTACQQPQPAESTPGKQYTLTGTVVSVDKSDHTVKIKGDPIPGWMDAMTMDYPLQNQQSLDSLHAGENIRAKLQVHDTDYRILDIQPANPKP